MGSRGWGCDAGQSQLVGLWWEVDRAEGVGGFGGSDFLVDVGDEVFGGEAGLGCGHGGWCQFIGVEVGEAGAKDGLEAGAGVSAGRLEVGESGGVVDEVDQERELAGGGLAVEVLQDLAGREVVAGPQVSGELADGGDEGRVVAAGADRVDAWGNFVNT